MNFIQLVLVKVCLLSLLLSTNACQKERRTHENGELSSNQIDSSQESGFDTIAFMEKWSYDTIIDGVFILDTITFMEKWGYDTIINGVFIHWGRESKSAEPKIGEEAFDREMSKKKELPQDWKSQGIEGIVRVTVYVDEVGNISFGQIWDFGFGSDSIAVDLIRSLGKWNPAISLETGEAIPYERIIPVYLH